MKQKILRHTIRSSLLIFLLLLTVHAAEAIFLQLDETILGENFLNKVFGIFVLFFVLRILEWSRREIGFSADGFVKSVLIGLSLAVCTFLAAYAVEILLLKARGESVRLGIFTTGFSLVGEPEMRTGAGCILMCVFFNIINVVMEEGVFRGLFTGMVQSDHTWKTALVLQALLFGVWHMVTPLHNLIDGALGPAGFLGLSAGYIILAGIMGIKWGLLYRMTGSLYAGMADHFFNNCVATNLLHVMTGSGTDEMQILRVLIAQTLSFALVMAAFRRWKKQRF